MLEEIPWRELGLRPQDVIPYGEGRAKIRLGAFQDRNPQGQLVLVSAMSPSPAGEGKTTVSIGLVDALRRLGEKAVAALREPSMGPVFGMKGGGTGAGKAQLVPSEAINLHFTGDLHAITSAHNLLSAVLDNHLHQGNLLRFDVRRVIWRRVLDVNDRALRGCVVGLGGKARGVPREDRFDITAASEVMAILALSKNWQDLRQRLGQIVVGFTLEGEAVRAEQLGCAGAMAALLRDALLPNLVRTAEGSPALVHCGPFANIAHGTSSLVATQMGLRGADWVVQEAGFGADLGGEKFVDIFCRQLGQTPSVAILVMTLQGLKYHGGKSANELHGADALALQRGLLNALNQAQRLRKFGLPVIAAINQRAGDPIEEQQQVLKALEQAGVEAYVVDVFGQGGEGALELARAVMSHRQPAQLEYAYQRSDCIQDKVRQVAEKVYGAHGVQFSRQALRQIETCQRLGFGDAYVCIAKTQMSLSDDPNRVGVPEAFDLNIREVFLLAGAGFVVPVAGEMLTMPGLPHEPNCEAIDLSPEGEILGVH